MQVVEEKDSISAYLTACKYLLKNKPLNNLIVRIKNPSKLDLDWLNINPKQFKGDDVQDVINTIFPLKLRQRFNKSRETFYEQYLKIHSVKKKKFGSKKKNRWGTYFQRLIAFPERKGDCINVVNQLETAIEKINTWKSRSETSFYFHLSSPVLDNPRRLGAPCLQFIQLLIKEGGKIDMVAVYRNHDFFNKAMGNYIGLGQLLKYICKETKKKPGELICHSAKAYHDCSKLILESLINL